MSQPPSAKEILGASPTGKTLADILLSSHLLDAVPDAMVVVERDGTIVQVNGQAMEMFGYTRPEMLGQKIEVLVPERYRPQHGGHRDSFGQNPKVRRMGAGLELFGRRRDSTEFPVEISLSPVSIGSDTLVLSAIRDITDRKEIEAELRRANEELDRRTAQEIGEYRARLASIIDSSEDAIIGKDLDGIITSWNKGAETIYGYRAKEVIGRNISLLAPPERPDEIPDILGKIRRGEGIEHFESVRMAKDGGRLSVFISVSPLRDTAGNVVGASAIARDITAQKRAEEHLRQVQKMEAMGRLAGGVSHDFNNVLGIISACIDLLRSRIDAGSESAEYVANMRKAVERGSSLTKQLLAFSRKSVVQPQVLDLNERLKETSKLLRPLMGDGAEIVLASHSGAALIEADPGQLDQIVMNLAVNSRDAMPHGGRLVLETSIVHLDHTFSEHHQPLKPGLFVLLAVSDTGIGMDAATMARVFEPFFTTKEAGKGTGLGLATVYGIVQQSGGHIWVYSEPGRGTTFKIYFPSAEHKIGIQSKPESEAAIPNGHGRTILLVEDDEIMLRVTRKLLEEHGYKVLVAKDGKAALELAEEYGGRIDLLLTDVAMPGVSGPELATWMGTSRPGIKVVFMSGYTGELMRGHDMAKGTLLDKPFTRVTLLLTVHQALG
jgi:two-component system, cell cycle sensor histidine kinase and response regulator CckA